MGYLVSSPPKLRYFADAGVAPPATIVEYGSFVMDRFSVPLAPRGIIITTPGRGPEKVSRDSGSITPIF